MFNVIGCKSKDNVEDGYRFIKCTACNHTFNDVECASGQIEHHLIYVYDHEA